MICCNEDSRSGTGLAALSLKSADSLLSPLRTHFCLVVLDQLCILKFDTGYLLVDVDACCDGVEELSLVPPAKICN
jgi:Flp pilus assembly CpaE family ATPase